MAGIILIAAPSRRFPSKSPQLMIYTNWNITCKCTSRQLAGWASNRLVGASVHVHGPMKILPTPSLVLARGAMGTTSKVILWNVLKWLLRGVGNDLKFRRSALKLFLKDGRWKFENERWSKNVTKVYGLLLLSLCTFIMKFGERYFWKLYHLWKIVDNFGSLPTPQTFI